MVFTNDHAPAHVHVFKNRFEIVIALGTGTVAQVDGSPTKAEIRNARAIVAEHIAECWTEWKRWHE